MEENLPAARGLDRLCRSGISSPRSKLTYARKSTQVKPTFTHASPPLSLPFSIRSGYASINNREGSLHRILERQSALVGCVFSGRCILPPADQRLPSSEKEKTNEEKKEIVKREEMAEVTYDPMRVHFQEYTADLQDMVDRALPRRGPST